MHDAELDQRCNWPRRRTTIATAHLRHADHYARSAARIPDERVITESVLQSEDVIDGGTAYAFPGRRRSRVLIRGAGASVRLELIAGWAARIGHRLRRGATNISRSMPGHGRETVVALQRTPFGSFRLTVFLAPRQVFNWLLHWRNTFHLNVPGSLPKPCRRLLRFGTIATP